jgi:hypothetical protein
MSHDWYSMSRPSADDEIVAVAGEIVGAHLVGFSWASRPVGGLPSPRSAAAPELVIERAVVGSPLLVVKTLSPAGHPPTCTASAGPTP